MDSNAEHYDHNIYKKVDQKEADATAWAFVNEKKFTKIPFKFPELGADELRADILYAGLCLSDSLHGRSNWGPATYPLAPGHEIIGEVVKVGSNVKDFKVGDKVAFGTMRSCCGKCKYCQRGSEPCCTAVDPDDKFTYGKFWGGYATQLQQPADHFFHVPKNLDLAKSAPLLCAGITVYNPIKKFITKGDKCAVIGVGGLGHVAVQFLSKMGYDVTGVTTSLDKKDLILGLGAKDVLNINDGKQVSSHNGKYDFIINTTPTGGDGFNKYLALAAPQGKFIQVGLPDQSALMTTSLGPIVINELQFIGSVVGSRGDINEMLELCAKENIYPMVEEFGFEQFPEALDKLENGKPKFRCVVNVKK